MEEHNEFSDKHKNNKDKIRNNEHKRRERDSQSDKEKKADKKHKDKYNNKRKSDRNKETEKGKINSYKDVDKLSKDNDQRQRNKRDVERDTKTEKVKESTKNKDARKNKTPGTDTHKTITESESDYIQGVTEGTGQEDPAHVATEKHISLGKSVTEETTTTEYITVKHIPTKPHGSMENSAVADDGVDAGGNDPETVVEFNSSELLGGETIVDTVTESKDEKELRSTEAQGQDGIEQELGIFASVGKDKEIGGEKVHTKVGGTKEDEEISGNKQDGGRKEEGLNTNEENSVPQAIPGISETDLGTNITDGTAQEADQDGATQDGEAPGQDERQ
nr:splicing regulatory glutamine/lysine-rich protein 1-like [Cherax quadricarinatus]